MFGKRSVSAAAPALDSAAEGDLRAAAGLRSFVGYASLALVYVHDTSKWTDVSAETVPVLGAHHASAMAQNAYLYAASRQRRSTTAR